MAAPALPLQSVITQGVSPLATPPHTWIKIADREISRVVSARNAKISSSNGIQCRTRACSRGRYNAGNGSIMTHSKQNCGHIQLLNWRPYTILAKKSSTSHQVMTIKSAATHLNIDHTQRCFSSLIEWILVHTYYFYYYHFNAAHDCFEFFVTHFFEYLYSNINGVKVAVKSTSLPFVYFSQPWRRTSPIGLIKA